MGLLAGKSAEEQLELFAYIVQIIEDKKYTLREVGQLYGVSRQRIQQFLIKYGYSLSDFKKVKKEERMNFSKEVRKSEDKEVVQRLKSKIVNLSHMLRLSRKNEMALKEKIKGTEEIKKRDELITELRESNNNRLREIRRLRKHIEEQKEKIKDLKFILKNLSS